MIKLFKILLLLIQIPLVLTCNHVNKLNNNKIQSLKLVPYLNIYKFDAPFDTILPNGNFVCNLVNSDTTDLNFYIKYGSRNFDSILVVKRGLESSLCARLEYCYSTENVMVLYRQCINSREMILLSLKNGINNIEDINPINLGLKDGLVISVCSGDGNVENGDSLLITNLDFDKKQFVKINGLNCADRNLCFEKVEIKRGYLIIKYWGAIKNYGSILMTRVVRINLV